MRLVTPFFFPEITFAQVVRYSDNIIFFAITFFSTPAKIRGGLSQDQGNANNATELYE